MKEEIIQKIKEAGVPETEVETFYELLSEQVLDLLFEDLSEKSSDEELQIIEQRIKEAKSVEHFESIIKELAYTAYGEEATTEISNMYLDLIDSFKKSIEDAKALIERANSGDTQAQTLLNKAIGTDEYKRIMGEE
jgi:hypothetical protein